MAHRFDYNKQAKVGDWECIVMQEPWNDSVKVYLLLNTGSGRQIATIKDSKIVMTKVIEGEEYKADALMILPYLAWESVLQVLGSIPSDVKQEVVDAELKATKYHLEDMRKLTFKGKEPK